MLFKRAALLLSTVAIVAVGLFAAPSAAAAAGPTATEPALTAVARTADTTADNTLQTNCPITSRSGNNGAYICETQVVWISWYNSIGVLVAVDDVVIGTNYAIYDDPGSGWRHLQGGYASSTANPFTIGLYILSNNTIGVIGTDLAGYCNTTTAPGVWTGWYRC